MHPNDSTINDYVDNALGPGDHARVEQHLHNVPGESIPVPSPEMKDLVSPKENAF